MASKSRMLVKLSPLMGLLVLLVVMGTTCRNNPPTSSLAAAGGEGAEPSANPVFTDQVEDRLSEVAEVSIDSVVNVATSRVVQAPAQGIPFFDDPFFEHFFGPDFAPSPPPQGEERSLGSGVVVSTDGVVLTNHHVVDRAEDILVTLHDGREFDAKLEGSDPKSDVAVLKLEGEVSELVPIEFGDSEDLRLGEMVLAIGNPFGLSSTVTMGIVSAKSRANMGIMDYEDFIQTDAAINPGNSGGALVNLDGDLVGINTAIISRTGGYQGVGLAIPSTMARAVMKSIEEHGKVMRGWLGVVIQDVDPELADAMGLEVSVGVVVADVVEGSPADEAGIERGDVIIEMNGAATDTAAHLRNEVAMLGPGRTAELSIVRGDEKRTVEVTLGELPEQGGPEPAEGPEQVQVLDGLGVAALDAATRSKLGIPEDVDSGVVVTEVAPGSAAHEAGLAAGDVIVQVDKKDVKSPAGFAELVEKAGDKVLLLVFRDGNTIFVVLEK